MEFKVYSITCSGLDEELEKILNSEKDRLKKRGLKIVSIMFIGYNSAVERIYQIVLQKD